VQRGSCEAFPPSAARAPPGHPAQGLPARRHIEQGALTPGYAADRDVVVKMLNDALATEVVCTLRYRRHYFMARGIHAASVAEEFRAHAAEELDHADLIAGLPGSES
jgi:hypothetical protein